MRIISQDRTYSINMDNHDLWTQSGTIYCKINIDSRVLGTYSSQERAKEVFKDIHNVRCKLFKMPEK